MTCPRCNGFLHTAQDEMKPDQGDVAELSAADCIKCVNCGHRIYPQIVPAVPFDKGMILPKQDMKGSKPGRRLSHVELMQKYYPSIKAMRKGKNPTSWASIASLISTAEGVKITGETVAKYFKEIHQQHKVKRGPRI